MAVENDVVLIFFEGKPLVFARIEEIKADAKPDWYHVKLLMLQVPLTTVTWILKDVYINGDEFTMNGNRMRLEKVAAPAEAAPPAEEPRQSPARRERTNTKPAGGARVISLSDLKKKSP